MGFRGTCWLFTPPSSSRQTSDAVSCEWVIFRDNGLSSAVDYPSKPHAVISDLYVKQEREKTKFLDTNLSQKTQDELTHTS